MQTNAWVWISTFIWQHNRDMLRNSLLAYNPLRETACNNNDKLEHTRNFMAKSLTITMMSPFSILRTSRLNLSCCTDRSWWAFHVWIDCLAAWYRKRILSDWSLLWNRACCSALPISCSADSRRKTACRACVHRLRNYSVNTCYSGQSLKPHHRYAS